MYNIQSFREVFLCIYTIWMDILFIVLFMPPSISNCVEMLFICLFNVRLKSMRLFPRLIIHSLFCCSWEIYDWLHDYIKTVSRLTDLKTTHLKTASFSPSFVPVVSGQSAALRDNTDQWGSPHPRFGSVNCNWQFSCHTLCCRNQ